MDYFKESLLLHRAMRGKLRVESKAPIWTRRDLSLLYTPGVAAPCNAIAADPAAAYELTMKGNAVAIVTDGSAVLGLGNIGPMAALPVMEGKAVLFREFAGIDAVPICLDTQDPGDIIRCVRLLAPGFGGVNLEDIAAPRCFEIEQQLQDIGIPVFHDDQHGTAIVMLAALINACKVVGKSIEDLKVVINGAGAAGVSIARLLNCVGQDPNVCQPVKEVVVVDRAGAIYRDRPGLSPVKREIAGMTNRSQLRGNLQDVLNDVDVFIGVSTANVLDAEAVKTMADRAIIMALANPQPEIEPDEARRGGAAVVCTGRSDWPNQVNNVLAFPGIFKGALMARAPRITEKMKLAAAYALAAAVEDPVAEFVIPDPLKDRSVTPRVATAVKRAWEQ